jgi:major membrane immunogen (membrane-anchored lipoprotein)
MKNILLPLAVTATLACTSCSKSDKSQIYVSHDTGSQDMSSFSRNANYELGKNTTSSQYLNVDIQDGNTVKSMYSKAANRSELQRLDAPLKEITSSNGLSLTASVKRILEITKNSSPKTKVTAYLITRGTSDKKVLSEIGNISNQIKQLNRPNLKIYLLGLSPTNKIPTSSAFNPIASQMAGSCINDYSQCRGFIADLR